MLSKLGQNKLDAVNELMVLATDRYQKRPGGYTRVLKHGYRYGDSAPKGVIMFVEEETVKAKKEKPSKEKASAA